ncbi:MarR family winged helix-turn-helix transcriptional regulator [Naumannella halotolerans]|uniref:MarR family winged helix-turn-helix transcriptional regulator n=1 Tax=Naumannella halotolerans TaxID=993414 RepID=UPI00370DA365
MSEQQARELIQSLGSMSRTLKAIGRNKENSIATSRVYTLRQLQTDDLRVSELAHRLCVDTSVTTRIVQSLETDGLVTRTADPADRRASLISTTEAGRRALARRDDWAVARTRELFADWSDEDAATATAIVARLQVAIQDFDQSAPTVEPANH